MTDLPDHIIPHEEQWEFHWAMRKEAKFPVTARTKRQAANILLTLNKEGFDIGLLLNRSTDNGWRSFWRHQECVKARPILETVTLSMLHRSDSERAGEVLKKVKVKRIGEQPVETKAQMMARLQKHL